MESPDSWAVLKIKHKREVLYKVLAGWSGGYLYGDSWRMNSGIVSIEEDKGYYYFTGYSGSVYKCHKSTEELRASCYDIYTRVKNKSGYDVKLVPVKSILKEFGCQDSV